jgi:hypothetical protein
VIQALKTIGRSKVDEKTLRKIRSILKNESQEQIIHDARLSPAWINKILTQAVDEHSLAHTTQKTQD